MGGGQTHCPLASIANAPAILAGCSDHTSLTNLPAHLPEKQQASMLQYMATLFGRTATDLQPAVGQYLVNVSGR